MSETTATTRKQLADPGAFVEDRSDGCICTPHKQRSTMSKMLKKLSIATPAKCPACSMTIDEYQVIRKLGEGSFSKVKLALTPDGRKVALKMIPLRLIDSPATARSVDLEIDILRTIKHENVIGLERVFDTDKYKVLVLEYCSGGDVFEYLERNGYFISENKARKIFRQVATGVHVLHEHGFCHRDLKFENVLIDAKGTFKLSDVGLAGRAQNGSYMMSTCCGSSDYAAPELFHNVGRVDGKYDGRAADVWSLGVILYALLAGSFPFQSVKDQLQGVYIMQPSIPPAVTDLIASMLTLAPEKRPKLPQILAHSWVAQPM